MEVASSDKLGKDEEFSSASFDKVEARMRTRLTLGLSSSAPDELTKAKQRLPRSTIFSPRHPSPKDGALDSVGNHLGHNE